MLTGLLVALPLLSGQPSPDLSQEIPSVHAEALQAHQGESRAERHYVRRGTRANLQRIVYGYLPYWVTNTSEIRWDHLSHVAYFSLELANDGSVTDAHGWPESELVSAAHGSGVKVEVAFTLFSASGLSTLLNSQTNRARAINNMIDAMEAGAADGISIDFEGVPSSAGPGLSSFCQELRQRLIARGHPSASISVAAPSVDSGNAFDLPSLLPNIDIYFIMGYDYFWGGSQTAGPTGIFRTSPTWRPYSSVYGLRSVADAVHEGGEQNRKKIVYGVPYYGREYTTSGSNWPASVVSSVGSMTYSKARQQLDAGASRVFDDQICQPALIWQADGAWHQCWYEDEVSLGCKYDLVLEHQIGGTGMWALGSDRGYAELWDLLQAKFQAPVTLGEGSRDQPIAIQSFPYQDGRDTSTGGYRYYDFYPCRDSAPEFGREFVYQVDLCQSGSLHVEVQPGADNDPDVQLLTSLDEQSCTTRDDVSFDASLTAGRYYVVVDTYVSNQVEKEGPYTLTVNFTPEAGSEACPAGTTCSQGTCVCPGTQTLCGTQCVDTSTDSLHCGSCDHPCGANQTCSSSNCVALPEAGIDAHDEPEPSESEASVSDAPDEEEAGQDASYRVARASEASGCACRTATPAQNASPAWLWTSALALLALSRLRRR